MCGITGFFGGSMSGEEMRSVVMCMSEAIRHRGPDAAGAWIDPRVGVALGHRRLSVIDLSPAGDQPMVSASGRYIIVFNGEIYNFQTLREEMNRLAAGILWRGHSDTEVLLAAFDQWGVVETLQRINGMFAFALWDKAEHALYLARDRMGEKPLYFSCQHGVWLFGSELKALRAHPQFSAELDRNNLGLFFRYNCIPAPYTVYQNVWKLPPASYVRIISTHCSEPVAYWSARQVVEAGRYNQFWASAREATEALDDLLRDAIKLRMTSDVPLGSFLSGGIDSSIVTALMQAQSVHPVRSFSIGFQEYGYNEASEAKAVAQYLGTDHTELYVTPTEAQETIPLLSAIYDEPFSDSSQIPTYLLAKLTRRQVTVALSGDGGDEVFGGYNRHTWVGRIWKAVGWLPADLRRIAARALTTVAPRHWNNLFQLLRLPYRTPGDKLHKLAGVLAASDAVQLYRGLTSHWTSKESLLVGVEEPPTLLTHLELWPNVADFAEQMMYLDSVTYLPDDILVKVDRATMAVSLEGRIPYLDHRVIEFAWRLPLQFKLRGRQSKWILRQVLAKYVPPFLTERPKSGFGIPIDSWLRGPLRDWAEALLDERRLEQEGVLNPVPVRQKWDEHLSGKCNWQYHLWDVLMFQMWFEEQGKTAAVLSQAFVAER
jgi:asparagine synthase (glutamine-hydrolysing)